MIKAIINIFKRDEIILKFPKSSDHRECFGLYNKLLAWVLPKLVANCGY